MDIPNVEMDRINEQNSRTTVSALHGFAPRTDDGKSGASKDNPRDTYVMDTTRKYVKELCDSGDVTRHIGEILSSGVEPDCLRAELAFRASIGDMVSCNIIINFLAGNFKEAFHLISLLSSDTQPDKVKEFLIYADYFAGRFDSGCERAANCQSLAFSPFIAYAYAEMLLDLGYVERAREYTKKYVALAKTYIRDFVSEKEKYDERQKRRDSGKRRNGGSSKDGQPAKKAQDKEKNVPGEQGPELYSSLKDLLSRRRVLLTALKTRNVSIDKKPLMFELEDIDIKIAAMNGRSNQK